MQLLNILNTRGGAILGLTALATVAAVALAVVTTSLGGGSAPVARPSAEVVAAEPVAERGIDSPRGALTFILSDGSSRTVRAGDPTEDLPASDIAIAAVSVGEASSDTYASPDGRYRALVRSDQQGTWLDVEARDVVVATFPLAGIVGDQFVLVGGKVVARAIEGVPLTVAWSPDSRRLAFGSIIGAPWTLNVVSVEDWLPAVHPVRGGYVGELAWSPDGSLLGVSTYEVGRTDHTVLIFDPGQEALRFLIDGCAITWSPDGKYVAVHREPRVEPGVWIAAVGGDLQVQASSDPDAFPLAWTN